MTSFCVVDLRTVVNQPQNFFHFTILLRTYNEVVHRSQCTDAWASSSTLLSFCLTRTIFLFGRLCLCDYFLHFCLVDRPFSAIHYSFVFASFLTSLFEIGRYVASWFVRAAGCRVAVQSYEEFILTVLACMASSLIDCVLYFILLFVFLDLGSIESLCFRLLSQKATHEHGVYF